ncbi:C-type lectin domain family 14 member A [Paralichthys olivaceus]|uniref:C-type lectin domain family 14 member A n=1 Tax=Paralichthys olivaceus TaxID=8255 RepID=UPI003751F4DF
MVKFRIRFGTSVVSEFSQCFSRGNSFALSRRRHNTFPVRERVRPTPSVKKKVRRREEAEEQLKNQRTSLTEEPSSVWEDSGKMVSWVTSCWIYLWIFVQSAKLSVDSASPTHYTIHSNKVKFDQAMEDCSPGVLTTLATEQEVTNVLGLISKLVLPQSNFTFWVGLKKAKDKCVVPTLPLRGFSWIEDDSEDSQGNHWAKEPQDSCTSVRCVVLQGESDGLSVTRWGLIPVTCRDSSVHQFICKRRDRPTRPMSEDRMSTIKPTALEPVTHEVKLAEPEPPETKPNHPMQEPEPETNLNFETKPEPDPGLHSGSGVGSNLCQHPVIPRMRSLRPDSTNRIQVECWSTYQLDLYCRGRPAVWRLLDDSPANLTILCQPCSDGFQKDASGNCVDLDECTSAPCRHTCLNTEGSYRCVCSDEDGKHHDEDSPTCTRRVTLKDGGSLSGILIPVLVSVAALVVLVVVVAVTVKCCLKNKISMKNEESIQI